MNSQASLDFLLANGEAALETVVEPSVLPDVLLRSIAHPTSSELTRKLEMFVEAMIKYSLVNNRKTHQKFKKLTVSTIFLIFSGHALGRDNRFDCGSGTGD